MCLALVPRPWNGLKRRFALIRYFPIKPIHLAFLLLLLYFLIFSWTMAGLGLFVFALFNLVRNYPLKKVFQSLLCLALFAAYFGFIQYKSERDMAAAPANLSQIQMLPDTISVNGDLLSFEGKSDGQTYQVFYKLKSQKEQGYFQKLDKSLLLKVRASTEEATAQRNFKGFDYRNFLRRKGIYRIARIEVLESLEEIKGLTFFELLQDWRRKAILYCQENFPAPMQHYMTGLLFGYLDKSFEDMTDLYSSLGIVHLFALSGMHVTFFLGLFQFVCLRIGLRLHVVDGLQLVFSVFYAGLTGFSVSVLRSLVQSSLATRGIKRLDNLAITVLILSIIRPNFLLTTGGVLSFSYAFVLALTSFEDLSRYARVLVESLALSLGVLPILIFYFSVYQPLSILLTAAFSLLFDLLVLPILTLAFCLSPVVKLSFLNGLFLSLEIDNLFGALQKV
jgi:competence protein ComEC